jgi:osmotically-inducible protein OsmY
MTTITQRRSAMMKRIGSLTVAVLLAVGLVACGAMTEESKRGHFDDAGITAGVEKTLAADQAAAFTTVTVQTSSGTVYLTGTVADAGAKDRATALARNVEGVRQVINNIQTPPA